MARTIRRKTYVPFDAISEWERLEGISTITRVRLEGDKLKRALLEWHSDFGTLHERRASKTFRKFHEERERTETRTQLAKFVKRPDFEVRLGRIPFYHWD